jgi:hypothetical protein
MAAHTHFSADDALWLERGEGQAKREHGAA